MAEVIGKVRIWLQGKKTYLVAASAIIAAVVLFTDGTIGVLGLGEAILAALGLTTLRAAITKVIEALKK